MCKAALASEWFIEDTKGLNTSVDLGLNLDFKVMNLIAMHPQYQSAFVSFTIQQNDSRERFAHVSYAGSAQPGVCFAVSVKQVQTVDRGTHFFFLTRVKLSLLELYNTL